MWMNKVNKVLRVWVERRVGAGLSGKNQIVEVDESRIGRCIYNRGKECQGQWIFGIYDRVLGQSIIVPGPDQTKLTRTKLLGQN